MPNGIWCEAGPVSIIPGAPRPQKAATVSTSINGHGLIRKRWAERWNGGPFNHILSYPGLWSFYKRNFPFLRLSSHAKQGFRRGLRGGLPINTWKFVFNFSVAAVIKRAHAHTPVLCSKRVDRVGEKGVNRGIGSMPILCIYMYVFVQPSKCKCATINNVHRQTLEKETSGLIKTTQTIKKKNTREYIPIKPRQNPVLPKSKWAWQGGFAFIFRKRGSLGFWVTLQWLRR